MPKPSATRHLTVRLPEDVRTRVTLEAAERRWSLNTYVVAAVEEKLNRDEPKGARRHD